MRTPNPIFEVTSGEHTFKIWADGSTEGFPDGSIITNRLTVLVNLACGIIRVNGEQAKANTDELVVRIHRILGEGG